MAIVVEVVVVVVVVVVKVVVEVEVNSRHCSSIKIDARLHGRQHCCHTPTAAESVAKFLTKANGMPIWFASTSGSIATSSVRIA